MYWAIIIWVAQSCSGWSIYSTKKMKPTEKTIRLILSDLLKMDGRRFSEFSTKDPTLDDAINKELLGHSALAECLTYLDEERHYIEERNEKYYLTKLGINYMNSEALLKPYEIILGKRIGIDELKSFIEEEDKPLYSSSLNWSVGTDEIKEQKKIKTTSIKQIKEPHWGGVTLDGVCNNLTNSVAGSAIYNMPLHTVERRNAINNLLIRFSEELKTLAGSFNMNEFYVPIRLRVQYERTNRPYPSED